MSFGSCAFRGNQTKIFRDISSPPLTAIPFSKSSKSKYKNVEGGRGGVYGQPWRWQTCCPYSVGQNLIMWEAENYYLPFSHEEEEIAIEEQLHSFLSFKTLISIP